MLSSTFDDGSYSPWVLNGNANLDVVTSPGGVGKSLKVSGRTHAYDGIALHLSTLLQRDVAYTISFKARLADDAQPAGGVHFTVDDGSYTWVSGDGALTAGDWTTVTGSYTLAAATAADKDKLYLDTAGAAFPDVLIDDVTITGPAAAGGDTGGGSTCTPVADQSLVAANFDDSTLGGLQQDGGPTLSYESVDGNNALRVSGRSEDYFGVQTSAAQLAAVKAGDTLTLSAKVRLVGPTDATAPLRLVVAPKYAWVGNIGTVSASGWSTITGTYTVPSDVDLTQLKVYVGSDPRTDAVSPYDYYVDDFTVGIQGVECAPPAVDPCTYPTSDTLISSDFENGLDGWKPRDDGHGVATVETADGGHSSAHALSVTNRAGQGQGVGHDVTCVLQPGVGYQFTGWVRFAPGQTSDDVWLSIAATKGGATTYSTLGQFTGVTDSDWKQVTAKFTMPAADSALLYLETKYSSGTTGNTSDLLFDDLQVTRPAAAVVQDLLPIKDTLPFPVGVAIDSRETTGAAAQLLLKHFDQVTPENYMKPETWYDADHNFVTTNTEADALMTFAQQNDIRVYGHNLVWHSQTPDWFFQNDDGAWLTNSAADQEILRQRMHDHIFDVAKYLSDKYGKFGSDTNPLVSFDVVNEVVSDASNDPEGLRQSHWYQVLGESYIEDAFNYADEAFNSLYAADGASHPISLFINDYNTEQSGKQQRLLTLVKRLIADDVPVDGVGHQFHVTMSTPVSSLEGALQAFEGLQSDGHTLVQAITELDVPTGTPVTDALLTDQGYYFKDVFDMLRAHADDLFSVTVWGLTDGRSWRNSSGAPLIFDDDLQAKPAYYGITDQTLPSRQRSAVVFQGDVPLGAGATEAAEWNQLPLHPIDDDSSFQLRWTADHLTAYVHVADATDDPSDGVQFAYGDQVLTFPRSGGDAAVGTVTEHAGGYDAVVHLPATLAAGSALAFDVRVIDGAKTAGWNSAGVLGTLQLVEPLSYTAIPEAASAPTIDGTEDAALWADAATVETSKQVSGTGGATAQVHTLWKDNTLYVLADVTDPTIDTSASDPWSQDSVEIFVDPGNYKNGSYRPDDTQIRISADNVHSFGTGDEAAQQARVTSATSRTDHGYIVEAAISLLENGGLGSFEGLDFQVNDATGGTRTAIHNWAEPTGTGYQTTARWGVGELVAGATTEPAGPSVDLSVGTVSAGGTFDVALSGFAPGTEVQLQLAPAVTEQQFAPIASLARSLVTAFAVDPGIVLDTLTVGEDGTVEGTLTVPADLPAGVYDLSAVVDGLSVASAPLTVVPAASSGSTDGGSASTDAPAAAGTSAKALAVTGGVAVAPWLGLGALLLAAGLVLTVRRRAARQQ